MIDYIKGTVAKITDQTVTLDVSGIGFTLYLPQSALASLPPLSSTLTLHVSLVIREFSQTIYGFLSENERNLFEKLLQINGIGPKLALSIVGTISFDMLYQACIAQDYRMLCTIPGVGKKTAERLAIELKDILAQFTPTLTPTGTPASLANDAVQALISLGYSQATAHKAIQKALEQQSDATLPQIITAALRYV